MFNNGFSVFNHFSFSFQVDRNELVKGASFRKSLAINHFYFLSLSCLSKVRSRHSVNCWPGVTVLEGDISESPILYRHSVNCWPGVTVLEGDSESPILYRHSVSLARWYCLIAGIESPILYRHSVNCWPGITVSEGEYWNSVNCCPGVTVLERGPIQLLFGSARYLKYLEYLKYFRNTSEILQKSGQRLKTSRTSLFLEFF